MLKKVAIQTIPYTIMIWLVFAALDYYDEPELGYGNLLAEKIWAALVTGAVFGLWVWWIEKRELKRKENKS